MTPPPHIQPSHGEQQIELTHPVEVSPTQVTTADGVALYVERIRPISGRVVAPVLLLHGLSANRYAFLLPERSLAVYLARRGFDVFVADLRGVGHSAHPGWHWDFHDHLELDVPALVHHAAASSGSGAVHAVGHSMGGILLMGYGMIEPRAPVASTLAIASSLDYRVGDSIFKTMYRLRPVLERTPIFPVGTLHRGIAPLVERIPIPNVRMHVHPSNIEAKVVRNIYTRVMTNVPVSLLRSLATTFEPEGLRSRDGRIRFVERASRYPWPLLLFAGSADRQAPPLSVEHTAHLFAQQTVGPVYFGRAHGHADDYGHYDIVLGRRAPEEVWPRIVDWLRVQSA